jgi:hypothetical protein
MAYQPSYAWKKNGNFVVVTEGDSLSAIAKNLNIEFDEFMKICDTSSISNQDLIYPKQKINCSRIFSFKPSSTISVEDENNTIEAIQGMQRIQEQSNQYLDRIVNNIEASGIGNISAPISVKIDKTNTLIKNGFSLLEEKTIQTPIADFFLGAWKWALSILGATISTLLISYYFTDDILNSNREKIK